MTSAPSTTETSSAQYISFVLADHVRGMIPTHQLAETINLELGSIIQIPDVPPAVVGVCSWRGEVLWLVDLSYALQLSPLLVSDYQPAKCSVLRVTVNQQVFGILVAEVRQLIRCDRQQIIAGIPPQIKPEAAPLISGYFAPSPKETVLNIDLEALLTTIRNTE